MSYRQVSHVIFDMDGLLLNTEPIYLKLVKAIAEENGRTYPWDVRMKIMGTTEQMTAQIAVTDLQLPITVQQFMDRFTELGVIELANSQLMPGAERLIRHLHESNVPIALATSSSDYMVDVKTKNLSELFSLFLHKVMGSTDPDVKMGKPAPDIFQVAAKRFKGSPRPENCLVFEDAPNGVKAGRAAGMQVVMVPDDHVAPELRKEATLVIKSLLDFKPELFGLPSFRDLNENLIK